MKWENPKSVELKTSRWTAVLKIVNSDDEEHEIVFSADSGVTWGDSLFVGDREEYEEASKLL